MRQITHIANELAYWLKRYAYILPPLQLLSAFVLSFFQLDNSSWVKWGNGSGFSIATGVIYVVHFALQKRFCLFTKVSAWSLLFIALFNFMTSFYVTAENYPIYESLYAKIITVTALFLTLILMLKKSK